MQQKFLFFYNVFAKINKEDYTLKNLKAFKHGPVFCDIYKASQKQHLNNLDIELENINNNIADITLTLMYLYKENISNITHSLDAWKNCIDKTKNGINESDLTEHDMFVLKILFDETKNVHDNYEIEYNRHGVPLIYKKKQKNQILNNFYNKIQSFNIENKCPTYVYLVNGEVYFD